MTEGAVCVANIGPKGIRRRMVKGAVALLAGVLFFAGLVVAQQPVTMRWGVAFFFAYGFLCIFQARAKT